MKLRLWLRFFACLPALAAVAAAEVRMWELELPPPAYCVDPNLLAANTVNGDLYAAGSSVLVVSPPGLRPRTLLPVQDWIAGLAFCDTENKLYCLVSGTQNLLVIDGATRTVSRVLHAGPDPVKLTCSPVLNRLLVANRQTGSCPASLLVYDCATDSLLNSILLDSLAWPDDLGLDPVTGRAYWCEWRGPVRVIDIDSGSVRSLGYGARDVEFNPGRSKVYAVSAGDVLVLDSRTDSLLARVELDYHVTQLLYNRTFDKVYCGTDDGDYLAVMDGATDTVTVIEGDCYFMSEGSIALTGDDRYLCHPCWADTLDRAFAVIDCASDSVVALIPTLWFQGSIVPRPGGPEACFASPRGILLLIDCEARAVTDTLVTTSEYLPTWAVVDPARDRLYCYLDCPDDELALVAETNLFTGNLLRFLPGTQYPYDVEYVPSHRKLYLLDDDLTILDIHAGGTRRVVRDVELTELIGYNPNSDRLYCLGWLADSRWLLAFDPGTDCIVDTVPLPEEPAAVLYEPEKSRMCLAFGDEVAVWLEGKAEFSYRIPTDVTVRALCRGPDPNLLCGLSAEKLVVLDLVQQRQVAELKLGSCRVSCGLCCSPEQRRLYCIASDSLRVINLDQLQVVISLPIPIADEVFYNSASRNVYCLTRDGLVTIDCEQDTVAQFIEGDFYWWGYARDTVHNRLYLPQGARTIVVFADTVIAPRPGLPQTLVTGIVRLDGQESHVLYDITGRSRAVLRPGYNLISHLPPGIYIARSEAGDRVQKVIIPR